MKEQVMDERNKCGDYVSWFLDKVVLDTRLSHLTAREASEVIADFFQRERLALQAAFCRE
jgi:hypothetical protein